MLLEEISGTERESFTVEREYLKRLQGTMGDGGGVDVVGYLQINPSQQDLAFFFLSPPLVRCHSHPPTCPPFRDVALPAMASYFVGAALQS